jgi:glycosyltransferase involved in cell wall biosynthesis
VTIVGLFLNNQVRTGGHRRYLELMESLAERGHRVVVALNAELDYEARSFEALRVPVHYRRGQVYPIALAFREASKRSLRTIETAVSRPDFVLIHGETHLPAATFLKSRLGCVLLFGHRSNAVREAAISLKELAGHPLAQAGALLEGLKYRRYERMTARAADVIVFQSSYDRGDFVGRVPAARARSVVIGGNIGAPRFKPEHEGSNRSTELRSLVFVGTLGVRKGLRYLLEALAILAERGVVIPRLAVLGSGAALDSHRAFLRTRGLADRVEFHGRVPDPFSYLAAADLMVVPSIFDSYPDAVLEALHVGVPVIASAVGGIPDMLRSAELLFPPRDAQAIADRIERCLRDPAYYRSLRALCAERLGYFHFDWCEAWERAMSAYISARGGADGESVLTRS